LECDYWVCFTLERGTQNHVEGFGPLAQAEINRGLLSAIVLLGYAIYREGAQVSEYCHKEFVEILTSNK